MQSQKEKKTLLGYIRIIVYTASDIRCHARAVTGRSSTTQGSRCVTRTQNTTPTQATREVFPSPSRPFSRISIKHKGGGNGSQLIALHNDRLNTSCILFEVNLLVTGRRAGHSQPPHKPNPCALTSPDLTRHSQ